MYKKVIYRNARKEEAKEIACYLLSAWPVEAFLEMSDDLTVEGLRDMVAEYVEAEDTIYSYRNTIVAEVEGRLAGAITGYDGSRFEEMKRPVIEDLEKRFGEVPYASVRETAPGEFYLDSIGVDPQMRSHGIGSGLFKAMIGRAAEEGHTVAGLLVDYDNPKAEALYLRLGFRYVDDMDFLGHAMKHLQISTEGYR